jgi:hypothetical protein
MRPELPRLKGVDRKYAIVGMTKLLSTPYLQQNIQIWCKLLASVVELFTITQTTEAEVENNELEYQPSFHKLHSATTAKLDCNPEQTFMQSMQGLLQSTPAVLDIVKSNLEPGLYQVFAAKVGIPQ